MFTRGFGLALASLVACGPGDDDADRVGDGAADGPRVAMDFARPNGLVDAPFPSDDLLVGGVVDLSRYPNPDAMPYVDAVLGVLSGVDGFGTTMGVFFGFDQAIAPVSLAPWDTVLPDSPVFLVAVDDAATRLPVDVASTEDAGPFGAEHQLSLLPLQGVPMRPATTYAAVVLRDLAELGPSEAVATLAEGGAPPGMSETAAATYRAALEALEATGVPAADIAGLAVFTTRDPVAELYAAVEAARPLTPSPVTPLALTEVYDTFCVFESTVQMPVYQAGEPPYETGGGWAFEGGAPVLQDLATSRLWVTVPRAAAPPAGWPVAVMVRTGGGGDRPMIDRGVRAEPGGASEPGTGPVVQFTAAGFAGLMVDGPHGGPRNVTGGDEQFLVFNVTNPVATRDNVRQSALELALLPDLIASLSFDASACPDAAATFTADLDHLALFGHSMGATIAPLTLAAEPRFGAAILSGTGGSYIHNIVYKQSPLEVRPLAEAMLNYPAYGLELGEHDPFLSVLQWAAEPADPPPYAGAVAAHALMVQGIVDTYILPPMANAASLSLGLDLGGEALDASAPELADMRSLEPLLPLVGRGAIPLPVEGNVAGRTAIVVQVAEDGVEDGHEVIFQTEEGRHAYQCFLDSWRSGAPRVPSVGELSAPCD